MTMVCPGCGHGDHPVYVPGGRVYVWPFQTFQRYVLCSFDAVGDLCDGLEYSNFLFPLQDLSQRHDVDCGESQGIYQARRCRIGGWSGSGPCRCNLRRVRLSQSLFLVLTGQSGCLT